MEIQTLTNEFLQETYHKINHPSGLTVYVLPKEGYQTTYAVFGTDYGSVDTRFSTNGGKKIEVPEGIAHFLEHKLFESEELDAFERYAKTGASANAYTSFDKTCYLFSCSDNFEESLRILLDFVKHPYFTEQTVEKEQGIIGQEIKMYQDNPDWEVLFSLLRAAYKENPVRIDIAGTVESIAQIDAQLLYDCYNTFYNNSNMVLAVAGNVTVEQVIKIADELLEKEERVEIVKSLPQEDDGIVTSYTEKEMHVEVPKFNLGFKEKLFDPKDLRYSIAVSIALDLICSKTTDFYAELLEKELINSSFGTEHFWGRGFNMIIFGGESEKPEEVKSAILERIAFLKENGFEDEAFEAIRRKKYGNEVKCFNDVDALANGMVNMHFSGYGLFDIFDAYRSITKKDVEDVIKSSFDESKCILSVIK